MKINTIICSELEKWEPAAELCAKWLEILKKDNESDRYFAECYMYMGIIKMFTQQKTSGQAYIDKAIEIAPDKKELQLQKASIMNHFQFYESAADEYTDILGVSVVKSVIPEYSLTGSKRCLKSSILSSFPVLVSMTAKRIISSNSP